MRITVDIPDHDGNGIDVVWDRNGKYSVEVNSNQIVLRGNKEALISFAKQMLYLGTRQTRFEKTSFCATSGKSV